MVVALTAAPADAQERSDFRLRGALGGGFVISGDQHSAFGLDLPVVAAELRAGWVAHEAAILEGRLGGDAFFSSARDPGGLIDLTLGIELGGDLGVGRAWGSVHGGIGVTGNLVRPVLRIALGLDVNTTDEIAIGPMIAYGHVFEEDGEGFSDDAAFATIGISFTHRARLAPPPEEPEPAPLRRPPPILPPTPPPTLPTPVEPQELMEMLDEAVGLEPRELIVNVLFRFDSTELVACSIASLHSLGDHLEQHSEIQLLEIEGHADGSGSDEYNRDLSLRRAQAIREWLIEHGVERERLRVSARGESAPLESNEEGEGRTQNRRARFRVVLER